MVLCYISKYYCIVKDSSADKGVSNCQIRITVINYTELRDATSSKKMGGTTVL